MIEDIVVYPQLTNKGYASTEQESYQMWLFEFPDDTFSKIRLHGHSHGNLAVYPSGDDLLHWSKIISQFSDDSFYIFLITNREMQFFVKVYDAVDNVLYESENIVLNLFPDSSPIGDFLSDALVKVKPLSHISDNTTGKTANKPRANKSKSKPYREC